MAVNEIQGSLVLTDISTDQITWKTLVCEQGSKFDITTNVTTEKTKCGPIKGIDDPDWKMSGDAVVNADPASDQVSYNDIIGWINAKTKVYIRKQSPASTTPAKTIGQAFFQQGEGYFTSVSGDYSNGVVIKFTWNFEGQGDLITTKPATVVSITPTPTLALTAPASLTLTGTKTAAGTAPFTYQWKKAGSPISGATSLVYTKGTTVAGTDSGAYTLVVTDDDGLTSTSNSTTVTVS